MNENELEYLQLLEELERRISEQLLREELEHREEEEETPCEGK